ncbi:MAG: GDSL-type esterase/lipase family protein [Ferruginibacter sp.]
MKNHIFNFIIFLLVIFLPVCTVAQKHAIDTGKYDHVIRVACIGASTTWGGNIEKQEINSYPAQLGTMLGQKWEVKNFGVDAAGIIKKGSLPYWNTTAFKDAQSFLPDVVIFNIGVNDTQPQNWQYKSDLIPDYEEMIIVFQNLSSHPIIYICREIPVFEDRWGIKAETVNKELDPMKRKIAKKKSLPVIDLYEPLKKHPEFFSDGIHPDAAGARIMALTVAKVLTGK